MAEKRIAFLSTAFGFGPVSKAVTIAREVLRRQPGSTLDYFGAGIDYQFAKKADAFSSVIPIDVDSNGSRPTLVRKLKRYTEVVSVLNFSILPTWGTGSPPLFVVDSLAWMWPNLPPDIDRARAYFVQRYLMPEDRLLSWRNECSLVPVGPIIDTSLPDIPPAHRSQLMVNISGCANPFVENELYTEYARVQTEYLLEFASEMYDHIVISARQSLHDTLRVAMGNADNVAIAHLPPMAFVQQMACSSRVLTAPGITTTLEALSLGKQIGFLLPQNYSQALLAERNREGFGTRSTLALSRFGRSFGIVPFLDERVGVSRTISALQSILCEYREPLRHMIRELLSCDNNRVLRSLEHLSTETRGQCAIVDALLCSEAVAR